MAYEVTLPQLAAEMEYGTIVRWLKREHVPRAMSASGIRFLVGKSFARIFYRNCVNLGLAIAASPAAVEVARDGSRIVIDTTGAVEVDGVAFDVPAAPAFVLELGAAGGLEGWTTTRLTE